MLAKEEQKKFQVDGFVKFLNDTVSCAVTDEYYMGERYHQRNVQYAPWSPNVSCNDNEYNNSR